jgi:hypothetical protein
MGAYTGRLKAAKVPAASAESFWRHKSRRRRNLKQLVLEEVPEATEYSDDEALCDPVEIVRVVKAFPKLAEKLREALSPYPDDGLAPEKRRHRPRGTGKGGEGRWDLLFIAFVASRDPAMESFWHRWRSSLVWKECGFEERPDYQLMRLRFIEFEQLERRGFREAAHDLIRNAKKHDPLIGAAVIWDASRFDSVCRLEHCYTDHKKCRELWEEQKKQLGAAGQKLKGPRRHLIRATDELYNEAKAQEVEAGELAAGELPASVAPSTGVHGRYQYFLVEGHLYRTLDKTSGLRKYTFPRGESWHGGLMLTAMDIPTGRRLTTRRSRPATWSTTTSRTRGSRSRTGWVSGRRSSPSTGSTRSTTALNS